MTTITREALIEATQVNLHSLAGSETISVEEWVSTQNQVLEQGPSDTLDKASQGLKCALALRDASDRIDKAKCTDLQGQIHTLQQSTDNMTTALSVKNIQLDIGVTELGKIRILFNHQAAELSKLQTQFKDTELELTTLKGEQKDWAEQVTGLYQQIERNEIAEARQINILVWLQGEVQGLSENKSQLEMQIADLQDECTADKNKINALCTELNQANQTLADMAKEKNVFENRSQVLNEELTKCKKREEVLMSENSKLQSQLTQIPSLKLQIQELSKKLNVPSIMLPPSSELWYRSPSTESVQRPGASWADRFATGRGHDTFDATAPSSGGLQHDSPFPWEARKTVQSLCELPTATLNIITSTTTTPSFTNSRTSPSIIVERHLPVNAQAQKAHMGEIISDGLLSDCVKETDMHTNVMWAGNLERLQFNGSARGNPMHVSNVAASPVGGSVKESNALAPGQTMRVGGRYDSMPRQDSSGDESEVPRSKRRKYRNRNVPMDDISEIRQIQKSLTPFNRESKVSIHTHLDLYEKIMRSCGIDTTFKKKKYLSWAFASSEQNFF